MRTRQRNEAGIYGPRMEKKFLECGRGESEVGGQNSDKGEQIPRGSQRLSGRRGWRPERHTDEKQKKTPKSRQGKMRKQKRQGRGGWDRSELCRGQKPIGGRGGGPFKQ